VNFLFDANCNPKLIGTVSALMPGHRFEDLRINFPDAKDPVWIPKIHARPEQWIVISGDKARFRKVVELKVLKRWPLTWVGLMGTYTHKGFDEQARRLAEAWPDLVRRIERQTEPWVYKIKQDPFHDNDVKPRPVIVEPYKRIRDL
jgi:hypothetical protein